MNDSNRQPIAVVGLGNPGFEYEDTRHNIGFMVVDEVSARHRWMWQREEEDYLLARSHALDPEVMLVKPLTFMNNSGAAVRDVLERYSIPLTHLLVVVDDFWLNLGTIRVRAKGSDGGHNGLRSVIEHLGTEEFARIRCGIRTEHMPPKDKMAVFVLSPFEQEEKEKVEKMIDTAADAVEEFVRSGIERTMNIFNTIP